MAYAPSTLEDRFSLKVDMRDLCGCWTWLGAQKAGGYGNIFLRKEGRVIITESAHVVSHELFVGPVPAGLWVLHKCDNPPCVRPDHLFLGPPKANHADMRAKGRQNDAKKLNLGLALEIRVARAAGVTLRVLAEKYGVSQAAVSMAARGLTFAHRNHNPRDI